MPPTRRPPWLAGALVMALALAIVLPVAAYLGVRRWPFYVGVFVGLLLLFGTLERRWQARPVARRPRPLDRSRFRVVRGGKGNGHAHDVSAKDDPDDEPDKPRWVM
jgi:hypothetical protein